MLGKGKTNAHALSGIQTHDPVYERLGPAPQTSRPQDRAGRQRETGTQFVMLVCTDRSVVITETLLCGRVEMGDQSVARKRFRVIDRFTQRLRRTRTSLISDCHLHIPTCVFHGFAVRFVSLFV
jgi:hypothetical protein